MNLFDQVSDRGLSRLPEVFHPIFGGIHAPSSDVIEEHVLPVMAEHMGDNFRIMFNLPPQAQTAVVQTPMGPAVVQIIRQSHGEYMNRYLPKLYENVPEGRFEDEVRNRMFKDGAAFALNDEKLFPVGDPSEAVLSLLYALGQRAKLGKRYDDSIRPQVVDAVGTSVVKDVENFVAALQNGMKEFVDPETNKKIVVTIEDFCEDAAALQKDPKIANLKNMALIGNPRRNQQYKGLMKKSGLTQTSLLKLSMSLFPYKKFSGVENFLNLLKQSMRADGALTVADSDTQRLLLNKLSEIFKGIPGISDEWLKSLVYNTDIPSADPAILHIEGYPVDVKKINAMTYTQASAALTPAVAEIIFKEDHTAIDLTKLTEFISRLINKPSDEAEKEEIHDRIVDPILREFAPDQEVSDDIGVAQG